MRGDDDICKHISEADREDVTLKMATNNELYEEIRYRLDKIEEDWEKIAKCRDCGLGPNANHNEPNWCGDDDSVYYDPPRPKAQHLACSGDHYFIKLWDSFKCGDQKDYKFPHIVWKCRYCGHIVKVQKLDHDPAKPHYYVDDVPGEVVFDIWNT